MTAQLHEKLVLDGQHTTMACCPPPPGPDRLRGLSIAESTAPPVGGPRPTATYSRDGSLINSTACRRGYQGIWEVRTDRLYFLGFSDRFILAEALFADWVCETLVVPVGRRVKYVHMDFASVYEREVRLTVDRGVIITRHMIENSDVETVSGPKRAGAKRWWMSLFEYRQPTAEERLQRLRQQAERDARLTERLCPACKAPCPRYRRTCRVCGHEIGRV